MFVIIYTNDFIDLYLLALPCPKLMDPRNGQYVCDGPQVTETFCDLNCTDGYELVGAKNRTCLSTGKWSENNSFCEILRCNKLNDPENGNVVLPCATELDTKCRILCSPGFYTNSVDRFQKCRLTARNTVKWTDPPKCIG